MNREGRDWIFVSDAHFTGRHSGEMESFIRFLNSEEPHIDRLIILGDFFEFLFGFKGVSEESFPYGDYLPVLKRLRELQREGVRIAYFEGNHDFRVSLFFSECFRMPVDIYPESWEKPLGEKRAFMAHGDRSNPDEWSCRILRRILKNRWSYGFIQAGGPRLARWVARKLSKMSYDRSHEGRVADPHPSFRRFAHRKFTEGFDVVILGHSHFPDEVEERVGARRCIYFNVGDWALHRSFLRFTPPDRFHLERFEKSNAECGVRERSTEAECGDIKMPGQAHRLA